MTNLHGPVRHTSFTHRRGRVAKQRVPQCTAGQSSPRKALPPHGQLRLRVVQQRRRRREVQPKNVPRIGQQRRGVDFVKFRPDRGHLAAVDSVVEPDRGDPSSGAAPRESVVLLLDLLGECAKGEIEDLGVAGYAQCAAVGQEEEAGPADQRHFRRGYVVEAVLHAAEVANSECVVAVVVFLEVTNHETCTENYF